MGSDVTTSISDPRAVRLLQYIKFIKTRHLLLIHLWLVCPPPLIPELFALLLPPTHGWWRSYMPLLLHHNVKYWPRGWCTPQLSPDLRPPAPHQWKDNTIVNSGTEAPGHKSSAQPNYVGYPMLAGCGVLRPTTYIQRAAHNEPLPHRTSQRSWCHPHIVPTDNITGPIYYIISGPQRASNYSQSTSSWPVTWRYQPSRGSVHYPGIMSL